jgi:hypothetical protein
MAEGRDAYRILMVRPEGGYHFVERGVDGRIILK